VVLILPLANSFRARKICITNEAQAQSHKFLYFLLNNNQILIQDIPSCCLTAPNEDGKPRLDMPWHVATSYKDRAQ
jgi:hypothetical protein